MLAGSSLSDGEVSASIVEEPDVARGLSASGSIAQREGTIGSPLIL